jgi:hypothetical protein
MAAATLAMTASPWNCVPMHRLAASMLDANCSMSTLAAPSYGVSAIDGEDKIAIPYATRAMRLMSLEIAKSHPGVEFISDLSLVNGKCFDKIFCLETLEHFAGVKLEKIVSNICSKLTSHNYYARLRFLYELSFSGCYEAFLSLQEISSKR